MTDINTTVTETETTVAAAAVPEQQATTPAAEVSAPAAAKISLRDIAQQLATAAAREAEIKAELSKLMAASEKTQQSITEAIAASAATTAAMAAESAKTDKALAEMRSTNDLISKSLPSDAELAKMMEALALKAATPAPAAKADWLDNTAVKIGLGVAAAGVVAGVGYFAYQKFFGGSNVTEA